MSKTKIPLQDARAIAQRICEQLSPLCNRIEIAGSIRREKAEVGDIEIVAAPKLDTIINLFGEPTREVSMLDDYDFSQLGRMVKGGSKYKQIMLHEGMSLDLFCVMPPAQWGVIFLIRTGSAEFSHKMVSPRRMGGHLPSNYKIRDGAIWDGNTMLKTPEEDDFFRLCNMSTPDPAERSL